MIKKTISYTDYDGNERTEDFYFNLSKAELIEMDVSSTGGLQKLLQKITQEQDGQRIFEMFKRIILKSYGEKSLDGKHFVKSSALSEAFAQTEAYSELVMELLSDEKVAAAFILGVVPESLKKAAEDQQNNEPALTVMRTAPAAESATHS